MVSSRWTMNQNIDMVDSHVLSQFGVRWTLTVHDVYTLVGYVAYISNDPSFRQKHPGVPDGSDGSDGTSYPLTENYTLPVAQATGRVAHIPPLLFCDVYAHQNDTCVTLFAVAAVMLKPFTQRLAMFMPFSGRRFFGNAAGAPGNHSYYLSCNDFQNLCIQFVFSSMYLCYLSTHSISGLAAGGDCQQFEVRLKVTIEWTSTSGTPVSPYTRRRSLTMDLEAVIERVERCTWGPRSSEFGDALGGRDRSNLEAVIKRVWRCTWRPWSCELGGRNWASLEIHLEVVIERVWRCTWRP